MSKKVSILVIAAFLLFIGMLFVLHIAIPDTVFSERENRYLDPMPEFSLHALFSGDFTVQFETYSTDHFPFRDAWVTLKAAAERASGKAENNGVYLCHDDMLIEAFHAPDAEELERRIAAVNALADAAQVPVCLALIPDKAALYADLLPTHAPNDSQQDLIGQIYSRTTAETSDLYDALTAHRDEYLYYRTDHHWTTLGAYYGYKSLCRSLGQTSRPLSDFTPELVSADFYGTLYSSSGFSWVAPDSICRYIPDPGTLSIRNYLDGEPHAGVLYDEDYLAKKDKYAMFLGGNTPLLQIRTGRSDGERLLLLRDSFADSLVPYLLDHYAEIHLIDLRYYKASVLDYITEQQIDRVIVLYSVSNFSNDSSLPLLAR